MIFYKGKLIAKITIFSWLDFKGAKSVGPNNELKLLIINSNPDHSAGGLIIKMRCCPLEFLPTSY